MDNKRFEELEVWKSARKISNIIWDITESDGFSRDYTLINQIRGASLSVMSNISEGHERDGDKEYMQFLSYAKGSAGEVRSQLYMALDRGYINRKKFDEIYDMLISQSRMLKAFIKYLAGKGYKEKKYKRV